MPVIHRHNEQNAVVFVFLPELPHVEHAHGEFLDAFAFQGLDGKHRHLVCCAVLMGLQQAADMLLGCRAQYACNVGDTFMKRGHGDDGHGRGKGRQQEKECGRIDIICRGLISLLLSAG